MTLMPVPALRECADITATNATSGVYTIYPFGNAGRAYEVYCLFSTDGEIWTVFQRRYNGSVDFYRNWEDYKHGFGSAHGEYWLGNEVLYALTQASRHTLQVHLTNFHGHKRFSEFRHMTIGGESDGYRLTVGQMKTGNAGDRLTHHCNHMMFSTYDRDNDASPDQDCAQKHHGAWWYADCLCASLNGLYHTQRKTEHPDGIIWDDRFNSYKESVMMLRRI